jgi:hypothetical protein
MSAPRPRPVGTSVVTGAAALDAMLVVTFAIAGRSSHAEGLDVAGVWGTAWPFLVGAAAGWVASLAWRRPAAVWPTGIAVWAGALVVGMALRALTGHGIAAPFIVVATITLALFLIGWRAVAALVLALRARRRTGAATR